MFKRYLILLVLLASSVVAVQAQDATMTAPIIALAKGDFWAINPDDGSMTQITQHRQDLYYAQPSSQQDIAISPDGQYLAYLQTPRFFAIAMKNNLLGNMGWTPSDIILLNLATGEERVIASQQPNVKYSDSVRLWYRWNLRWSPDGSQLAYYQYRGWQGDSSFQSQMMIYDWQIDKTFTLAEGNDYLSEAAWLREGIGIGATVYNAESEVIAHHYLNDGMIVGHPLVYQGTEYIFVDSADVASPNRAHVYLMDVRTGEYGRVEGYESSVSASAPEGALVFIKDDNDTRPWYVIDPQSGAIFTPPRQAPYAVDFTFSPDGKQFAYVLIGTSVNITDLKGKELVVDLPANAIIWGSKQYIVGSREGSQDMPVVPTTDFDTTRRCGILPAVGLVAGGEGRVIAGGGPNRVRSAPDAEAEVIGQIPEGATFTVVDGQQGVCAGAIRWAQISYDGVIGWTAQGVGSQVFLEAVA